MATATATTAASSRAGGSAPLDRTCLPGFAAGLVAASVLAMASLLLEGEGEAGTAGHRRFRSAAAFYLWFIFAATFAQNLDGGFGLAGLAGRVLAR